MRKRPCAKKISYPGERRGRRQLIRSSLIDRVAKLYQRLSNLKALEHAQENAPAVLQDREYLADLRRRINIVKSNLRMHGEEKV